MNALEQKKPRGRPRKTLDPKDDVLPPLSKTQRQAIAIEVKGNEEGFGLGMIKAAVLAKKLGVSRTAVWKMRKNPIYIRWFHREQRSYWQSVLESPVVESPMARPNLDSLRGGKNREWHVRNYVNRTWTGPVKSPIDDTEYSTEEELIAHLLVNDVLPAELVKEAKGKDDKLRARKKQRR